MAYGDLIVILLFVVGAGLATRGCMRKKSCGGCPLGAACKHGCRCGGEHKRHTHAFQQTKLQ